jgi:hypothetical protein
MVPTIDAMDRDERCRPSRPSHWSTAFPGGPHAQNAARPGRLHRCGRPRRPRRAGLGRQLPLVLHRVQAGPGRPAAAGVRQGLPIPGVGPHLPQRQEDRELRRQQPGPLLRARRDPELDRRRRPLDQSGLQRPLPRRGEDRCAPLPLQRPAADRRPRRSHHRLRERLPGSGHVQRLAGRRGRRGRPHQQGRSVRRRGSTSPAVPARTCRTG